MGDRQYLQDRLAAALACLQPGIDPVFLVLISNHPAIPESSHGLIVGASQFGMMLGAVLYWRAPDRLGRRAALCAAAVALLVCLLTVQASSVAMLVALRMLFGLCTGLLYTRAASKAAARRASHAFGTIFLIQLLLSSLAAAMLPWLAGRAGTDIGIATLALVPAMILLLVLTEQGAGEASATQTAQAHYDAPDLSTHRAGAIAAAAALFFFICATMMIWSHVGAAAAAAGLEDAEVGWGVAIGSLSGVAPALATSYLRRHLPLLIGCGASALAMTTPLLIVRGIDASSFAALMVLFNIGSTYVIIRCAARAVELNATGPMRRAVSAVHPVGMTAGPLVGFAALGLNGNAGLVEMVLLALLAAMAALAVVLVKVARPAIA